MKICKVRLANACVTLAIVDRSDATYTIHMHNVMGDHLFYTGWVEHTPGEHSQQLPVIDANRYINLVPYFPEYKSHFLSRNLREIFDMQLVLRMREKGGVTVDFTHLTGHLTSDLSLVSRGSCTHDALVLLLHRDLPSPRAIPRERCGRCAR